MKRVLLLAVLVAVPGLVFAETEIASFGLMMNSTNVPSVIGDRSTGGGDISIRIDRDADGTATSPHFQFDVLHPDLPAAFSVFIHRG